MAGVKRETYYRDHWLTVEPERLEAYEEMFRWRPQMDPMLEPAALAPGPAGVDYGCGPGHLAVELARRVGPEGCVHAVDINEDFLKRTERRAAEAGVGDRLEVHAARQDRTPLPDASVDRVICKNVLEYVDDPVASLAEFRRVLRPTGLAHAIDSDWGMLVVEPLGPERIEELSAAARLAYRTPLIGRALFGAFRSAGFEDVQVRVLAGADTSGRSAPVLFNMASYARASGSLPEERIEALLDDLRAAIADGSYMMVLPQFLVTGRA